jgi:RNA polymerase sigma factor (sigma-70 family)
VGEDDFGERVGALRRGEPEAVEWMFRTFKDDVERCFRRRPPEDRADLVQDVFVTAMVRLHSFQGEREAVLRAWLRSIAFHRWHHRWEADRVRQRHAGMPLEMLMDVNPRHRALADQSADPCLGLVERETVGRFLGHLTPGQAEVVRAHILEGKTTDQIARDWGVPRERVRGLYKRGIARLRRCTDPRELRGAA